MIHLSNRLSMHESLIADEYKQLGKIEGSGLFRKKIFISYDRDEGFNCVKLNLIQLFLRNAFGLYYSTHVDTIVRGWNRSTKGLDKPQNSLISKFDEKIRTIWEKTYHKDFPSTIFFNSTSLVKTYAEGRSLGNHVMKQYEDIKKLLLDEKFNADDKNLEQKISEFIEDSEELVAFFDSDQKRREHTVNKIKKFVLENFDKLKKGEIDSPVFKYLILFILQKVLEDAKKNGSKIG
jgi:hypothetical protein